MSERSGKFLLGMILVLVGGVLILDLLGIDLGNLLGIAISILLMVYGARRIIYRNEGSRMWGVVVFLIGLLMLIGKLHLIFSSLLAIGIIYFGYRLLRRDPNRDWTDSDSNWTEPDTMERHWAKSVLREDTLDRWERDWKARRQ